MSNRPKIFLLGPTAPYRGGIAETQAAFARALEALNVDVTMINFKKLYPSFLFPGSQVQRHVCLNLTCLTEGRPDLVEAASHSSAI